MHPQKENPSPAIEPELGVLEQSLAAWETAIDARWRRIQERATRLGLTASAATEAGQLVASAEQQAQAARDLRRAMLEKRRSNARMLDAHASEVELILERARHFRPTVAPTLAVAQPVAVPAPAPAAPPRPAPTGSERRQHRRATLEVDVTLASDHNFFVGFAENISEGGLFIATHNVFAIGAPVDLTFRLPTGGPMEVHCVVRWVRAYNPDSDTPPGVGVEFVNLSEADQRAVLAFLQQRDPLFHALALASHWRFESEKDRGLGTERSEPGPRRVPARPRAEAAPDA